MSWLGNEREFIKWNSKEEIMDDFCQTTEYEIPHRFAEDARCVCVGTVKSIEEAKQKVLKAWERVESGIVYAQVETTGIPKTTQEIAQRKFNEEKKLMSYVAKNNCYDRKSATIGCKNCGSSLATKYMAAKKLNKCPLCGSELRSDTVLKTIQGYQANIKKYEKQYAEGIKKARGKSIFYYGSCHYYVG